MKRFTKLTLALTVTVLILLSANVFADDVETTRRGDRVIPKDVEEDIIYGPGVVNPTVTGNLNDDNKVIVDNSGDYDRTQYFDDDPKGDIIPIILPNPDSNDKPIILPNPDSNEPVVDPDYEWIKRELDYDAKVLIGINPDEDIKDWYEFVYSNPMVSPYEMLNWYGKITLDEFKAMYGR